MYFILLVCRSASTPITLGLILSVRDVVDPGCGYGTFTLVALQAEGVQKKHVLNNNEWVVPIQFHLEFYLVRR